MNRFDGLVGYNGDAALLPIVGAGGERRYLSPKVCAVGIGNIEVNRIVTVGRAGDALGAAPGRGHDRRRLGLIERDGLRDAALSFQIVTVGTHPCIPLALEPFLIGPPGIGFDQVFAALQDEDSLGDLGVGGRGTVACEQGNAHRQKQNAQHQTRDCEPHYVSPGEDRTNESHE